MSTPCVGSILIPACNEEAVIGRTLRELSRGLDHAAVETVVACNGCVDATATVARTHSPAPVVLELGAVGKSGAIRIAEEHLTALPRIYLDADVELTGRAAMAMLAALAPDGDIAARPPAEFVTDGASHLVRRFYAAKVALDGLGAELCGAGVYGLSAVARGRFDTFPDIAADDLFAARVVQTREVRILDTDPVRIRTPRTVRAQVRVLSRAYRGNREFADRHPEFAQITTRRTSAELIALARRADHVVDVVVYVGFVLAGRAASMMRSRTWSRDDTTRTPRGVAT